MFIKDIPYETPKSKRSSHSYERLEGSVRAGGYTGSSSKPSSSTAAQLLTQAFSDMSNIGRCYVVEPGTTGGGGGNVPRRSGKETAKPEDEIKTALKDAGIDFDSLSDDIKKDVLKKYNTYTSVLHLEGDVKSTRITNYVKALQAHQTEEDMAATYAYARQKVEESVDADIASGAVAQDNRNAEVEKRLAALLQNVDSKLPVIKDSDIAKQKVSGTDEQYMQSLVNRGEGYVDMYDTDNNGTISFEEFKALEEKDNGAALTPEDSAAAQEYFNRLDKNKDGSLDKNEMASHLYAASRLYDGSGNSVEDITFKEWYGAQLLGQDQYIDRNYNYASDQLYGALKKD